MEIDNFSRPFHGLAGNITSLPSDESLGYYHSSAIADWEFGLSGKARQPLGCQWPRTQAKLEL
jgi:hypothetical protein